LQAFVGFYFLLPSFNLLLLLLSLQEFGSLSQKLRAEAAAH
jgi:hypothetical protein